MTRTKSKPQTVETPEPEPQTGIRLPPLQDVPAEAYLPRRVEARLSSDEAAFLKQLVITLDFEGATLKDGTHITKPCHALRWLLQQPSAV